MIIIKKIQNILNFFCFLGGIFIFFENITYEGGKMKKIFKVLLCISIMSIFGIKGVKADVGDHVNLTKQDIDNVWAYHYRNGEMWSYGQLPFRYANDKLVYCIQPDVRISTNDYIIYDFSRSGYGEEAKQKMELIAYYGYKYDGHNDLKYYIATQDLIWRLSPDEAIKWTTGGEYGEEIDISKEKNEIIDLINKHNVLPEFNNSINEVKVNERKEFIDKNNVLSNYDIEYSSDIEVIKEGNKLIVTPKKMGEYTIKFVHKKNYDSGTFLYDNFNTLTQSVAIFGAPTLIDGSMKIVSDKIDVTINKKDEETKELIKLEGIKIKIKNLDTDTYIKDTYEFNDGKISLSLKEGNYKIEEISSVKPYSINEGLEFSITKDDTYKEIDFFNKRVKCEIVVFSISGDIKLDSDFEVYDLEDNLIYKGRTTNGEARFELEYGNYKIKELSVPDGYILNENEISLEVNDKSCASRVTFNNDKVIMPITSKESNIGYLIILFLDLIGYVFIKKNN